MTLIIGIFLTHGETCNYRGDNVCVEWRAGQCIIGVTYVASVRGPSDNRPVWPLLQLYAP